MKPFVILILLAFASNLSQAQISATITGTVTDSIGTPIAEANVFIASSMVGTTTNANGEYRLSGIPLGTLRLVVSRIGYEPSYLDLFIRNAQVYTHNFQIKEKIYELGEVTVASDNRRWQRQLERFTTIFIGESPNAQQTVIMNPQSLDFSSQGGDFRAQASEPLIIENRGLGYKLTYFLNEFIAEPNSWRWDGEPLFETLTPSSPEEAAQWNARRDSAFYGSFRHFLLSVINDQVENQGFKIYSRPRSNQMVRDPRGGASSSQDNRFPIKASEILQAGVNDDERVLDFEGFVDIVYTLEVESNAFLRLQRRSGRARFQTSTIRLDRGPTLVDLKGDTLDPYGVTFYGGYFAYERTGDQIPKEYRPWIQGDNF
ncbi:MAG: carboxypeptidase-like regulatory domain-containing protein [Bacteroidetes bacterium]|nr:carboxypeptidase-like regulatory domain-containing protein [Bacteroidota bacterium]MCY4234330.1 carboxypeptidase-like regulatory domain-containing protein [Bacteroidota bacterium]